jgi:two-component system sensor histidine kinase KdpD
VREWCDPAEILREAVEQAQLSDGVVEITTSKDLPMISVDARLVEQALVSLLSNAAAHNPKSEPIEVSAARNDNTVVFSVADHGPGLASGEESKVFEKFYRGPGTAPGGLGLGLSIARQLIEAQSGEIIAQNREHTHGSRFSIRIPVGETMRLPCEATA